MPTFRVIYRTYDSTLDELSINEFEYMIDTSTAMMAVNAIYTGQAGVEIADGYDVVDIVEIGE